MDDLYAQLAAGIVIPGESPGTSYTLKIEQVPSTPNQIATLGREMYDTCSRPAPDNIYPNYTPEQWGQNVLVGANGNQANRRIITLRNRADGMLIAFLLFGPYVVVNAQLAPYVQIRQNVTAQDKFNSQSTRKGELLVVCRRAGVNSPRFPNRMRVTDLLFTAFLVAANVFKYDFIFIESAVPLDQIGLYTQTFRRDRLDLAARNQAFAPVLLGNYTASPGRRAGARKTWTPYQGERDASRAGTKSRPATVYVVWAKRGSARSMWITKAQAVKLLSKPLPSTRTQADQAYYCGARRTPTGRTAGTALQCRNRIARYGIYAVPQDVRATLAAQGYNFGE